MRLTFGGSKPLPCNRQRRSLSGSLCEGAVGECRLKEWMGKGRKRNRRKRDETPSTASGPPPSGGRLTLAPAFADRGVCESCSGASHRLTARGAFFSCRAGGDPRRSRVSCRNKTPVRRTDRRFELCSLCIAFLIFLEVFSLPFLQKRKTFLFFLTPPASLPLPLLQGPGN